MHTRTKPPPRSAQDTKARIVEAAQAAFAERGYSQTGLRDIAGRAGVATSLVIKYFETKANLFEVALKNALDFSMTEQRDGSGFGEQLVEAVSNPRMKIEAPAMIALSLGDEEAREISAKVLRGDVITRMAAWLGPPNDRARAASLLMLSMGFAIFTRHVGIESSKAVRDATAQWTAKTLQDLIGRA